ncbi:Mediator complex, subunit Med6 [Pseudohyphozyma bogoriensis]|nr:Mediator complex, subunit Med6 [Pseudohyphozyma bogoriensis]
MAVTELPPPPNSLSHLQWRATEWILAFGPLTPQNVMDYFALSPFFDRRSTNAQLRMQMMFSRGGMAGVDEEAELRRFVGIEYTVATANAPSLFVIHKSERTSPTAATPLAVYYILNDNIYQSPSIYSVLNERLLTATMSLSSSLALLESKVPQWTPEKHYAWDIKSPADASTSKLPITSSDDSSAVPVDVPPPEVAAAEEGGVDSIEGPAVEEEKERTGFNPLLFRALQAVSSTLSMPPPPAPPEPVVGEEEKDGAAEGSGADAGMDVDVGTPASGTTGGDGKKRKRV